MEEKEEVTSSKKSKADKTSIIKKDDIIVLDKNKR